MTQQILSSTEYLYAIDLSKLNALIGFSVHRATCETRLAVLKANLRATMEREGSTSLRVNKIAKAIKFWEYMLNEEEILKDI